MISYKNKQEENFSVCTRVCIHQAVDKCARIDVQLNMEEVKYEKLAQKDYDTEEKEEETNIAINDDDNTSHNDDEDDGEDDDNNAAQTDKIRKEDIKFKITGLTNKKILLR